MLRDSLAVDEIVRHGRPLNSVADPMQLPFLSDFVIVLWAGFDTLHIFTLNTRNFLSDFQQSWWLCSVHTGVISHSNNWHTLTRIRLGSYTFEWFLPVSSPMSSPIYDSTSGCKPAADWLIGLEATTGSICTNAAASWQNCFCFSLWMGNVIKYLYFRRASVAGTWMCKFSVISLVLDHTVNHFGMTRVVTERVWSRFCCYRR